MKVQARTRNRVFDQDRHPMGGMTSTPGSAAYPVKQYESLDASPPCRRV
ncbi:hypothetical protein JOF56_009107 [Kibdelosporangium banguiense]|uniref:Uncharacterized protein n=1 Tax=Kibdelosporangium banguiense TaxID=1365924 RepID=A0ABS4TWE6_9PSEU|nr:hypothetical protein [Kibdelosporangium banguiense]